MSTELSNGVIIPEEYSDDWYDEMSINLRKLNDVITAASDNATDIQRLDTDKANQSDLTALTSRVSQNETDIIALQTAVSGALKREIVQTLPTEDISTTTIYMIRNSQSSGTNIYDEYMYINSQWELIGTSATDFSNYYTKNETDNLLSGKVDNSTLGSYYTKTESDNLLSAKANQTDLTALSGRVTQNETDITALQTAVSGALKREIVQSLPTQDISTTTIYMIRNTATSGDNIYDEYMYINNLWELIGTSATDFSNYYTKTEIDTLLSGKADDNSVVHTSGVETVGGQKTFSDNLTIYNSDNTVTPKGLTIRNAQWSMGESGATTTSNINFLDKNSSIPASIVASKGLYGQSFLRFSVRTKDSQNTTYSEEIYYDIDTSGNVEFRSWHDNIISLGTSIYRWKSVYATNYYYGNNNVEFSTKFVTSDTAQTITETKTFTNTIKSQKEIELTGNRLAYILPEFSASYSGLSLCTYSSSSAVRIGTWKVDDNDNDNTKHVLNDSLGYLNITTGSVNSVNIVYLTPRNTSKAKLGDSTNKWKEINGITPSSMSIPNFSGKVDITSYISNLSGSTNTYTPSANGWLYVGSNDASYLALFDTGSGGCGIRFSDGVVGEKYACIPCQAGRTLGVKITCTNLVCAYFVPCLGNI